MNYLFEQGHFIEDQDNDLSQHGGRMENILKIRKALSYLTDKQHNVLIAHYINSLSFREIARRIDVNKSTVIHHSKMAEKIKSFFCILPNKLYLHSNYLTMDSSYTS